MASSCVQAWWTTSFEHGADEIGLTVRLNSGTGTLEGFLADSAGATLSLKHIDVDQAVCRCGLGRVLGAVCEVFELDGVDDWTMAGVEASAALEVEFDLAAQGVGVPA